MATNCLSMKLLVDNKTNKVLFAEAGKDVVDFLFSLLTMPLATIVNLLAKESMVGSIGNLYGSVENLDQTYIINNFGQNTKSLLLNPTTTKNTLFSNEGTNSTTITAAMFPFIYYDSRCLSQKTVPKEPSNLGLPFETMPAPSFTKSGGFVKGVVTYSVMDDLTVMPMSTISSVAMLNKFYVKDVGSLEERSVNLGMKEGLELLKASLQSKTVLTDVFIGK